MVSGNCAAALCSARVRGSSGNVVGKSSPHVTRSLRLTSRNWSSTATCARGRSISSNNSRAGSTLEMRSRITTTFFCVSQLTFSMANACCTAVIMALKSCALVGSGRYTEMDTVGSTSWRFCGVSFATRKSFSESGTTNEPVAASSPQSASR